MKQLMVWVALLLKALLELSRKKKIVRAPTALQANLLKYLLLSRSVVSDSPRIVALQAPVCGIFQGRILEWGAISFSNLDILDDPYFCFKLCRNVKIALTEVTACDQYLSLP